MLQKAFKNDCISRSQSGKWHKAFKEGLEEVADEPRSGCPTTARTDENVDRVLEVLRTDRRLSIQQIADTLHMSTFVVHGIVTEDLQMRKVCAKLVPKVLTQDQKELRVLRCQELLDLIKNEPDFLSSVVTGDESWMFEYDLESKRQSCAWHTKSSPRPKKARMRKSRIKTMIIVCFDIRGIVHCEFVPQGETVNSAFYLEVLRKLKRRIARVRTDIKTLSSSTMTMPPATQPSSLPTSWPGATPRIVTENLKLKKTPAKFIPRFLTNEQKLCRLATCEDILEMTRTDPEWKDKIITGDETWVYGYDPETKRQSAEWRGQSEPRPKKSRILKSRNKVLLVAFLDNKGIVHHGYLPAGQTVIKEIYLGILRRLNKRFEKKGQKN
ncbi:hypothetical protein LAZ67_11002371 [Cordylochernes scorpioides]|uniref:Transposase n=1 Tax=Cordylochernes scorpioides TaxID=51811 RepID=A0ABY6L434_9ARAC|nr:hypothetical protein LAZ67_11002371 [Cordylochernes scorpioides]